MSDFVTFPRRPMENGPARVQAAPSAGSVPLAGRYLAALAMVAGATLLAFVVQNLIAAPNLTLIYVLPVIVAGVAFGWGPSLAAVITGVLAWDFFFTEPYFSFTIYRAADIWAAVLLLVVAAVATTVAAKSRRRALEARRATERAEAIQDLAHIVIKERPSVEILQAAAKTLRDIFRAPAVIFLLDQGSFRRVASAGNPEITAADEDAARGALSDRLHTRAKIYPYDQAEFEFWPVETPSACRAVLGVDFTRGEGERPDDPDRFVDVVSAYVAVALERAK